MANLFKLCQHLWYLLLKTNLIIKKKTFLDNIYIPQLFATSVCISPDKWISLTALWKQNMHTQKQIRACLIALYQGFSFFFFLRATKGRRQFKVRCLRAKWSSMSYVFLCILELTKSQTSVVCRPDLAHGPPFEKACPTIISINVRPKYALPFKLQASLSSSKKAWFKHKTFLFYNSFFLTLC